MLKSTTSKRTKDLCEAIRKTISEKGGCSVALDGRCASGKTTAASYLSAIFGCDAIRADDFFLPADRKTPERLSEAGGNFDRERFFEEITKIASPNKAFTYRAYVCSDGSYITKSVRCSPLLLIEGVYCLTPGLCDFADIKVFSDAEPETQKERLLARSPEKYDRFVNEWIPLEEAYFKAFGVKEKCDFILK